MRSLCWGANGAPAELRVPGDPDRRRNFGGDERYAAAHDVDGAVGQRLSELRQRDRQLWVYQQMDHLRGIRIARHQSSRDLRPVIRGGAVGKAAPQAQMPQI